MFVGRAAPHLSYMKIALLVDRVLLTLLGISTGLVKIFFMENEMVIFRNAGSPDWLTVVFGVVQLLAALLLIPSRTVRLGAAMLIPTFVIATGVLFVNEMFTFGVVSLLFIVMAVVQAAFPPERAASSPGG